MRRLSWRGFFRCRRWSAIFFRWCLQFRQASTSGPREAREPTTVVQRPVDSKALVGGWPRARCFFLGPVRSEDRSHRRESRHPEEIRACVALEKHGVEFGAALQRVHVPYWRITEINELEI